MRWRRRLRAGITVVRGRSPRAEAIVSTRRAPRSGWQSARDAGPCTDKPHQQTNHSKNINSNKVVKFRNGAKGGPKSTKKRIRNHTRTHQNALEHIQDALEML